MSGTHHHESKRSAFIWVNLRPIFTGIFMSEAHHDERNNCGTHEDYLPNLSVKLCNSSVCLRVTIS